MTRLPVALVFLTLLAAPVAAEAQPPAKVPSVGFLSVLSQTDPQAQRFLGSFRQGLQDLGLVEGRNIVLEYRWAEGKYERLAGLAAELVRLKVDIIFAATFPVVQAAQHATGTIPIVMTNVGDPVESGLVASIARPGSNITGLSIIASELVGKQLELLRECVPRVSQVAVLWNSTNPGNGPQLRAAESAAHALGMRVQPLGVRDATEIDRAFAEITKERAGALLVLADPMLLGQRARIANLAVQSLLPAVSGLREHAEAGGLMAYGANLLDFYRRAAAYVDRILKGAKPADLPVEQPTKFELVINMKTAKALGLTIPQSVLLRADEVIQ